MSVGGMVIRPHPDQSGVVLVALNTAIPLDPPPPSS